MKRIAIAVAGCFAATASFADHPVSAPEIPVYGKPLQTLPTLTDDSLSASGLQRMRANTSDTASLLEGQPGISLQRAGGVSSLPSMHGLADDRIRIRVDGIDLISACANHMNPPLSYIDPADVGSVRVLAGITPVSMGGDSIAGTITVDSAAPEFASSADELLLKGSLSTFYRSNNDARGGSLSALIASDILAVRYTGATAEANDYHAGKRFRPAGPAAPGRAWLDGDEVGSTAYRTENHALDIGLRHDNHLLEFKVAVQDIPYQNFPNQRMDMTDNDSERYSLRYTGEYDWGTLQARVWHERTRHSMNFGADKQFWYGDAPGMPMETEGRNTGFRLQGDIVLSERDLLRVGTEYQRYRLDDDWPASGSGMMMGPGTFHNIRNGERDRYAVFGEWEAQWNAQWMTQLGLRHETVKTDAGRVRGYNTMGGMMGYGDPNDPASVPGAFNAADRSETDHNIDLTAIVSFTPDERQSYEAGYAMKTRSPNLYERYVWSSNNSMVMNMNNWYGDGNGYVGNLDLDPEVAHTISVSGSWHDASQQHWSLKLTPYLTYVRDYIDAVDCAEVGKVCPARPDGFRNLSLDNQRARIVGVDLSGRLALVKGGRLGSLEAKGMVSYTRGRNLTSGDDLYRIMPLNMRLALDHRFGRWSNSLELKLVDAKDRVHGTRGELKTAGYGLLNFYSSYEWKHARLDVGIENLLDKGYDDPLGGAYLGQGATMGTGVPHGIAVPGMGRSINTALTLMF
ncbi:MAG TPA: TonB-dependent receptor [Methylophilaceae bacterium]